MSTPFSTAIRFFDEGLGPVVGPGSEFPIIGLLARAILRVTICAFPCGPGWGFGVPHHLFFTRAAQVLSVTEMASEV